jgi:hypothetical protein
MIITPIRKHIASIQLRNDVSDSGDDYERVYGL